MIRVLLVEDTRVAARRLATELAREDGAVYGARLTGGGFGGSVVMLAHAEMGALVAERIARTYAERSCLSMRLSGARPCLAH